MLQTDHFLLLGKVRERESHFKELAHMIVKARQVPSLQGRPREELQFESKSSLLAELLFFLLFY